MKKQNKITAKIIKDVYKIVSQIKRGNVLTYKKIAQMTGISNPRIVGKILHKNHDPIHIPCHRVVKSDGKIAKGYAFGGQKQQEALLRKENIVIVNHKIYPSLNMYTPTE